MAPKVLPALMPEEYQRPMRNPLLPDDNKDGSYTITYPNSIPITVRDGARGPQGPPEAAGGCSPIHQDLLAVFGLFLLGVGLNRR